MSLLWPHITLSQTLDPLMEDDILKLWQTNNSKSTIGTPAYFKPTCI